MDCEKNATNCTACSNGYDFSFDNNTKFGICKKDDGGSSSMFSNGWVWIGAGIFVAIVILGVAFMVKSKSSGTHDNREYQLSGDDRGQLMS